MADHDHDTAAELSDVDRKLFGVPVPHRRRWQPLRAGIYGLFRYAHQEFTFYNGRALLTGGTGSGKSMTLEVLLPYLLDANLRASRLSTFDSARSMEGWLLGADSTRNAATGYVWVEFARVNSAGVAEYFTIGAGLQAVRGSRPTAWYFTCVPRIGIDVNLVPDGQPRSANQLKTCLADIGGELSKVHASPGDYRNCVNRTLFGLDEVRFAALRNLLLTLRRPKLSEKLDPAELSKVLSASLRPLDDAAVNELAEGFERLERIEEDNKDVDALARAAARLHKSHVTYLRQVTWLRADAVRRATDSADSARKRQKRAADELDALRESQRRAAGSLADVRTELSQVQARITALRDSREYKAGEQISAARSLWQEAAHLCEELTEVATAYQGQVVEAAAAAAAAAGRHRDDVSAATAAGAAAGECATPASLAAIHARLVAALADAETAADVEADVAHVSAQFNADIGAADAALTAASASVERLARARADADAARGVLTRAQDVHEAARVAADASVRRVAQLLDTYFNAVTQWWHSLTEFDVDGVEVEAFTDPEAVQTWLAGAVRARREVLDGVDRARQLLAGDVRTVLDAARTAADGALRVEHGWTGVLDARAAQTSAVADYVDAVRAWRDSSPALAQYGPQSLDLGDADTPAVSAAGADAADVVDRVRMWRDAASTAATRELTHRRTQLGSSRDGAADALREAEREVERLSASAAPALEIPPTRLDSRHGRPGGPLYSLTAFADDVPADTRACVEAALIGAGAADAWVSPDGSWRDRDGRVRLDVVMSPTAASPAPVTLADMLVVEPDAAVPGDVLAALLGSVAVTEVAEPGGAGLCVGLDGSWSAGTLSGRYHVDEAVLFGAQSRERERVRRLGEAVTVATDARTELQRLESMLARVDEEEVQVGVQAAAMPDGNAVSAAGNELSVATAGARERYDQQRVLTAKFVDAGTAETGSWQTFADFCAGASVAAPVRTARVDSQLCPSGTDPGVAADLWRAAAQAWNNVVAALTDDAAALTAFAATVRRHVAAVDVQRDSVPSGVPYRDGQVRAGITAAALSEARSVVEEASAADLLATRAAASCHDDVRSQLVALGLSGQMDNLGVLRTQTADYARDARAWLHAVATSARSAAAATAAAQAAAGSRELAEGAAAKAAAATSAEAGRRAAFEELQAHAGQGYQVAAARVIEQEARADLLISSREQLQDTDRALLHDVGVAQGHAQGFAEDYTRHRQALDSAEQAFLNLLRNHVLDAIQVSAPGPHTGAGDTAGDSHEVTHADTDADDETTVPDWPGGLTRTSLRSWCRTLTRQLPAGDPKQAERKGNDIIESIHTVEGELRGRMTLVQSTTDNVLLVFAARNEEKLALHDMVDRLNEEGRAAREQLAQADQDMFERFLSDRVREAVVSRVDAANKFVETMNETLLERPTASGITTRMSWIPDMDAAPGIHDVVKLLRGDVKLLTDDAKDTLSEFFRTQVASLRASGDQRRWSEQFADLLDYRRWFRFEAQIRRDDGRDNPGWEKLTARLHGTLSGGEKSITVHLPLFAAVASYYNSSELREHRSGPPLCPRLILLDEIFAGIDDSERGGLFALLVSLDMDLLATGFDENGMKTELDGTSVYLLHSDAASRTTYAEHSIWDGAAASWAPPPQFDDGAVQPSGQSLLL